MKKYTPPLTPEQKQERLNVIVNALSVRSLSSYELLKETGIHDNAVHKLAQEFERFHFTISGKWVLR